MKIGVVREMALGDLIMATGVIRELKRKTKAQINVYTRSPEVMKFVSEVDYSTSSLDTIGDCDKIYDLNLAYERVPNKPVWLAYANVVFGEGNYKDGLVLPDIEYDIHWSHQLHQKMLFLGHTLGKRYVVLHPCNSTKSRQVRPEVWNVLAHWLKDEGYTPVVVGATEDYEINGAINLKNRLTIFEVMALIQQARLFIGVDSGLSHIAMGTKTPAIITYTTANPKYRVWRPEKTIAIQPEGECKFCLSTLKPPVTSVIACGSNYECVNTITANMMMSATTEALRW